MTKTNKNFEEIWSMMIAKKKIPKKRKEKEIEIRKRRARGKRRNGKQKKKKNEKGEKAELHGDLENG